MTELSLQLSMALLVLLFLLLIFWGYCRHPQWSGVGWRRIRLIPMVLVLYIGYRALPFPHLPLAAWSPVWGEGEQRIFRSPHAAGTTVATVSAGSPGLGLAAHAAQLNPVLPIVQGILRRMEPAVVELLGMNGPRTYLVLVQNNHELRATGGFISAVGKVTLDNGELRELEFVDSYDFFRETLEYGPAPKPMQQYMNVQLFMLRDANWSPDLPTTAKLVQGLYTQQTGIPVAGVIAVDLHAAALMVDAIGPLTLPGSDESITGSNFVEQVVQFWEKPLGTELQVNSTEFADWWGQRKNFVTALAQAARQRLQSREVSYLKLLWNLRKGLRERSIQIWLEEPLIAKQLSLLGWDGGLHALPDADFVALVDTNMGFNKVDAVLERNLSYAVTWPDGPTQPALATATITYTHPISLSTYTCTNTPEYGESYTFLIERCYYDYVRLYTPLGSTLTHVEGVEPDSVVTQRGENRTQYFAGYFVLPVGQQHTVTFHYRLPAHLTPEKYQLLLRRQAGSTPLSVTVNINGQSLTTTLADGKLRWPSP